MNSEWTLVPGREVYVSRRIVSGHRVTVELSEEAHDDHRRNQRGIEQAIRRRIEEETDRLGRVPEQVLVKTSDVA